MILIRLMGGLGNQMFQYAFGLAQSLRSGQKLKIDLSLLDRSGTGNFASRKFALAKFNCSLVEATPSEVSFYNGQEHGSLVSRFAYRLRRTLNPDLLIVQDGHSFNSRHLNSARTACYVGRWQSEEYFKDYASEVRKDFTLVPEVAKNFSEVFSMIKKENQPTASLHIRRTDYVADPFFSANIGFVGEEYYKRAVALIEREIGNCHYFVFSDDSEWAEAFLRGMNIDYTIIDNVSVNDSAIRDLVAMSLCDHHIIANSTFSWWAAWLGRKEGIVVAPSKWAINHEYVPPRIYPPNWVTI